MLHFPPSGKTGRKSYLKAGWRCCIVIIIVSIIVVIIINIIRIPTLTTKCCFDIIKRVALKTVIKTTAKYFLSQ